MSVEDIDYAAGVRMAEYLKPEDLNTDACVELAGVILAEAGAEYIHAVRAVRANPTNKDAAAHLRACKAFYRSDYFAALSMGAVDGETVRQKLAARA
jgi:hypothetical protein